MRYARKVVSCKCICHPSLIAKNRPLATSPFKHTCHLIRHADIFGFTAREREPSANLARYHR